MYTIYSDKNNANILFDFKKQISFNTVITVNCNNLDTNKFTRSYAFTFLSLTFIEISMRSSALLTETQV